MAILAASILALSVLVHKALSALGAGRGVSATPPVFLQQPILTRVAPWGGKAETATTERSAQPAASAWTPAPPAAPTADNTRSAAGQAEALPPAGSMATSTEGDEARQPPTLPEPPGPDTSSPASASSRPKGLQAAAEAPPPVTARKIGAGAALLPAPAPYVARAELKRHTVDDASVDALRSDGSTASLRARAQLAMQAAASSTESAQRASAYSAAAAAAASHAAEAAEAAAAAASSAQVAAERGALDALAAAEARIARAAELALDAERKAAEAAATATFFQDTAQTQAAQAERAAAVQPPPAAQSDSSDGPAGLNIRPLLDALQTAGRGVSQGLQPARQVLEPLVSSVGARMASSAKGLWSWLGSSY